LTSAAQGVPGKGLDAECPGRTVRLDISLYALTHCEKEVVGRLHLGSGGQLPFPTAPFDCVLSINTVHNLPSPRGTGDAGNPARDAAARSFSRQLPPPEQKEIFESWVLTAEFHDFRKGG